MNPKFHSEACADPDCVDCRRERAAKAGLEPIRPGMGKRAAMRLAYQKWGRGAVLNEVRSPVRAKRVKQVGATQDGDAMWYGQGATWEEAHLCAIKTLGEAEEEMKKDTEKKKEK